jgi:hypothetical protein
MRWIHPAAAVATVSLAWLVGLLPAADPPTTTADEMVLKTGKVGTDGPALLDYLRKQMKARPKATQIQALIRNLGNFSYDVREEASDSLVRLGVVARTALEKARDDRDVEIARRAEQCLARITGSGGQNLDGAVIRLLAARKPDKAAEGVLGYLPFAITPVVADEAQDALTALALRDGKPENVLVTALTDTDPVKRSAAAIALCRAGAVEAQPAVRALLRDSDAGVRFQTGLALVATQEKAALPVLIDLLAQLPRHQAWEVEDVLIRAAGTQAPAVPVGTDEASRKKCRDAWAAWWAANGEKLKLEAPPRTQGHTLVILLDATPGTKFGVARMIDGPGKTLWEIKDIEFPLDAQLLPGDKLLCAEHGGTRVTERDRKGAVVWQVKLPDGGKVPPDGPILAQRLANGNTFISMEARLLEVDKKGKELWSYVRPNNMKFRRAQKMPNGDIVFVTEDQLCVRLGPDRKEMLKFEIDPNSEADVRGVRTNGGRLDVLPNGHVLLPLLAQNKVVEYDHEGKAVWEAPVDRPVAAVRLPNGHALVTTFDQKRAVELDRAGREVWQHVADVRVTRAWRR